MSSASVSQWIAGLKSRDSEAARRLWDRFSAQLVERARRRLEGVSKGVVDEEDIAQSVFRSIWRGAVAGRLNGVQNRDDLWLLMLAVTKQKVIDLARRESAQKRGGGKTKSEADLAFHFADDMFSLDWLIGEELTADYMVAFAEESRRLLNMLRDATLRSVAISRIEGYTIPEIAGSLGISARSVERKLQLIRREWAKELFRDS